LRPGPRSVTITLLKTMPETPQEKLKKMTASTVEPVLADGEIDELLSEYSLTDADGLDPGNVSWKPTYDMTSAAAAGWLLKAARATVLVEVDPPGSGIVTSKVFDNCRAMARSFRPRNARAVSIKRV